MNAKIFMVVPLLLASGLVLVQAAEPVDVSQLPATVQRALKSSGEGELKAVKAVTIRNIDGRTIYDVEFEEKNRPNRRLLFGADGAIIRRWSQEASAEDYARAAALTSAGEVGAPPYIPRLNLGQLPGVVQQTVRKEAAGRQISSITRDRLGGQRAYSIEFREPGRNPRLYVSEDGTILRPEEKPPALLLGTTFTDVPTAVQDTIRRETGTQQIVKIDRHGLGREPRTFSVDIKGNPGPFQLRIAEDGRILNDSRRGAGQPTGR